MYRSSLTLAFVVLCSATASASDLSSVYVAPGGIYAPSANIQVRPRHEHRPYVEPGYGYRSYGAPPAYRAPAAVYGDYGPAYAAQLVYVERAPVCGATTLWRLDVLQLSRTRRFVAVDGWPGNREAKATP